MIGGQPAPPELHAAAMNTVPIDIRPPTPSDAAELAELHREAWRYAYRGIIPGLKLERMVMRRGVRWWRHMHSVGRATLILDFDGAVAGYVSFGRNRTRSVAAAGEIYELYLRPEFHGAGLGRRLFEAARRRLRRRGLNGLVVRSLAANEAACRFYRARGGREYARSTEVIGGARLPLIVYVWP